MNSYRGITLSSVISKVLEFLLLERLEPFFLEANTPHPNQSAYRKKTSCADAILTTQEAISRYVQGGDRVFMCLYDLSKAFDLVEYSVLLRRLFNIGIYSWQNVENNKELVYIYGGQMSSQNGRRCIIKTISCREGSEAGFSSISDTISSYYGPLSSKLQSSGCGLSINCFLHADDIRTLAIIY